MKKYRLFGLINPFDVLIVLAVAALVMAASVFAAPQRAAASDGDPRVRYTIELSQREEGFHKEVAIGDLVYDSTRGYEIGTITEAYALPFRRDTPDEANNRWRRAIVPGQEFTYVVLEAAAQVDDYATNIGQYSIAVNKEVFVRSKTFAGQGYITAIEYIGG